jgi:hypothetical protein
MLIKSLRIGLVGLVLSVASAWAGSSSIQGIVKDAKGQPIKGANIRIEARNPGRLISTAQTDLNGRYVSDGLSAGDYRVTLVVNGTVKSSISNAHVGLAEATQLNFDLTSTSASHALPSSKKGTHWVWLPPFTGSRLPGRWIEVDDNGSWAAAHYSNEDVIRISGEELQWKVHSAGIPRGR